MHEESGRPIRRSGPRAESNGSRGIPPFHLFLAEHRRPVHRFLAVAAGPEADDCFQETFLAALRAYPKLRNADNLRGWVLAIATRKAIDAARSRRRRPISVPDVSLVRDAPGGAPGDPLEPGDPLWQAVRALPRSQRAAVAHRFVLDLSYPEIAATMGTTEEAARANVYQGLKKLRKEWRDARP